MIEDTKGEQRAWINFMEDIMRRIGVTRNVNPTGWKQTKFIHLAIRDNVGIRLISMLHCPMLTKLDLKFSCFTNKSMRSFIKINLPSLNFLNLEHCQLKDKDIAYLSLANWPHLSTLCLTGNDLTLRGAINLCKADWRYLHNLNFENRKLSSNIENCLRFKFGQFVSDF